MESKYAGCRKEIPFQGRNGVFRQSAVLDGSFFGWDAFSLRYGLVDACGVIPEETEKQHVHDYDQVILFISSEPDDMLHLGAELEVDLGAEGVRFRIAVPKAVIIPKGVPHFSPVVHRLERPFYYVSISFSGELKAAPGDENAKPETGPWNKFLTQYPAWVRELTFAANDPYHYGSERSQPSGGVSVHIGPECGLPLNFAWSVVRLPHNLGPWREDGLHHPHAHEDFEEALIFLSLDQDDLTQLHGTADFCVGDDGDDQEHCLLTKATVMAMPKGVPHLPLTYTKVDRPSVFITLSIHENQTVYR